MEVDAADDNRLPFNLTPFGSLSLEVRHRIFALVFQGSECTVGPHGLGDAPPAFKLLHCARSSDKPRALFVRDRKASTSEDTSESIRRSILFTCRQLYFEAFEIYAKQTQFFFLNVTALELFSPYMKNQIDDVCVSGEKILCTHTCQRLFRVLSSMEKLRVLSFATHFCEHVFELSCPLRNLRGLRELRLADIDDWLPYFEPGVPTLRNPGPQSYEEHVEMLAAQGSKFQKQVTRPKRKESSSKSSGLPFFLTRFGQLPLKVRMKIYNKVLFKKRKWSWIPTSSWLTSDFMDNPRRPRQLLASPRFRKPSQLDVLLTCRQIHQEAYPVFYNINYFTFQTAKCFHSFLESIGKARRHELTRVDILMKGPDSWMCDFSLLLDCHKLQSFRARISRSSLRFWTENPYIRSLRGLKWVVFTDLDSGLFLNEDPNRVLFFDVEFNPRSKPSNTWGTYQDVEMGENFVRIAKECQQLMMGPWDQDVFWERLGLVRSLNRGDFKEPGTEGAMDCDICRGEWWS